MRISEERTGVKPDEENGLSHAGMNHSLGQFMRFMLCDDLIFEPILTNPVLMGLITYLVGSFHELCCERGNNTNQNHQVYKEKPVQANINLCMDTGRPSKVFRDKTKNYGKNLHGQFLAAKTSTTGEPRRVVIHHVAGINVRDAATMCVALE